MFSEGIILFKLILISVGKHVIFFFLPFNMKPALVSYLNYLQKTYLDQFARAIQVNLLCQLRCAKHFWSKVVNVGYRLSTNSLMENRDLILL